MCDYSLEAIKSRPAVVGEKLVTRNFGHGTSGFAAADCTSNTADIEAANTAVCLLPGTELAFDAPVQVKHWSKYGTVDGVYCAVEHEAKTIEHKVARFAKINREEMSRHHDGLEFPDTFGVDPVLLTHLLEGQTVTVLQLPADIEAAKAQDEATRAVHKNVPEYTD